MKLKKSIHHVLFLIALLSAVIAKAEPRAIAHADIKYGTDSIGQLYAWIDIVGLLDRPDSDGVYRNGPNQGEIQYRIPGGDWNLLTTNKTSPVFLNTWTSNGRTMFDSHVTEGTLDLRVCNQSEGCSVPYVVRFLPKLVEYRGTTPGKVSKAQPILKVVVANIAAGNLNFLVGKSTFDSFGVRQYTQVAGATLIGPCGPRDSLCDVQVPAGILETPGNFLLSVTSALGSGEMPLQFEVVDSKKAVFMIPDRILQKLAAILTIHLPPFSGSASQAAIKIKSPLCPNGVSAPILDNTNGIITYKIPPPCLPTSGNGEMTVELKTPSLVQTQTIPFSL